MSVLQLPHLLSLNPFIFSLCPFYFYNEYDLTQGPQTTLKSQANICMKVVVPGLMK